MNANIIISNLEGTITVEMPRTRRISAGGVHESKQVKTTSGRIVEEMIGFRQQITAYWEYVDADTMRDLCALLRTGAVFNVTYPDISGVLTKQCRVVYPAPGIFKFKSGVPVWYGVNLIITATEVE